MFKQRQVKFLRAVELSQKYGMEYIETRFAGHSFSIFSAKTGEGVVSAFERLAKQCADQIQASTDYVVLQP